MLSHFVAVKGKGTKRRDGGRTRARKQRQLARKMMSRVTLVLSAGAIFIAILWFVLCGAHQTVGEWIVARTIDITAQSGFIVENFLVEGRINSDGQEILGILNIKKGDPIFAFDPSSAKQMLEHISWVEKAHVERRLPNTVYINLTERAPKALWKNDGVLSVIDEKGLVLTQDSVTRFSDLIMVSGDSANERVMDLIPLIQTQPLIKGRLDLAQWVENRRWNLRLTDGKIIMLPENGADLALSRLIEKQNEDGVLDKPITSIDVRDSSRFIVETERGKVQDYGQGGQSAPQTSL